MCGNVSIHFVDKREECDHIRLIQYQVLPKCQISHKCLLHWHPNLVSGVNLSKTLLNQMVVDVRVGNPPFVETSQGETLGPVEDRMRP
jgi:hypothetical protein